MFGDFLKHSGELFTDLFSKDEVLWLIFFLGIGGVVFVSIPSLDLLVIVRAVLSALGATWWLWFFLILFPLCQSFWLHLQQERFKRSIEWVLLELRIPREVEKGPQAMEQILAALHTLRNAPDNFKETYREGQVTRWFSLEMVSRGGEMHFYIRTPAQFRNMVEALFFSYYQDVEVHEVEDYIRHLPEDIYDCYRKSMECWGAEMILAKDDAYPIKTYGAFGGDEKGFDPMSVFLEVLSKVKIGETVGIQILIAPAASDWEKQWTTTLDDLRKPPLVKDASGASVVGTKSPGQSEVLKAVETNLSKLAFDTLIRLIYIAPREGFLDSYISKGISGAFNQYSSPTLNGFKGNKAMGTKASKWKFPYVQVNRRTDHRKQRILLWYRDRAVPPETEAGKFIASSRYAPAGDSKRFTMNIECLASIFHPPTAGVLTAPHIHRVESKKAGPPAGLAIFGEEGDIESFFKKS